MDVGDWLRGLSLERYEPAFRENNVTGEILPKLTAEDLRDLGVVLVGDRRLLLEAISALRAEVMTPVERAGAVGLEKAEAERRQLTVMFFDLVGSTALSGRLDPEDYREVIKSFQKTVSEAVRRFDGYVAKYLGDGILVYFGYPQAHEDDAERSVRSGVAALDAVRRLETQPGLRLEVRVGIATGLVVVGDIAEEGVSETGAISGETPNLAARLQSVAAPGEIIVSPSTHKLVEGIFDCEALGPQSLKGIASPTYAWRVRMERPAESRFDARHAAGLTEFVGRKEEVELLLRLWGRAKKGEGQVVLISGEPGIGKSRLTQYVRGHAGEAHMALKYQCSPHHMNSALYPVISQLTFAAGIMGDEPATRKLDKLEKLLAKGASDVPSIAPYFADLLSIPYSERYTPLGLAPPLQKKRTLEALKDQLLGLARRQPVFLVFEDLHWIDPTTQELLDLIVDRIRDAPVLALMTSRPEYQLCWVGQPHVTLTALNRLSRQQCAEIACHVAAQTALPAGALDVIVRRTEGIPLFIEELTRSVLEGGVSEGVPTTIHASLLARLDRLGAAKQVAQMGAVIGREFNHSMLVAISPIEDQELDDALVRLVSSELVFQRGTPPDATYVFKHALVQDAAYESLLKSKRRKLHADIVGALRSQFPLLEANEPELLAHHYSQAGLAEVAVDYWGRAGKRALERSANVEALAHYRAGLALLEAVPAEKQLGSELTLQIGLGSALSSVEGYSAPATGAAYLRAREICLALGDKDHLLQVLYGLASYDNSAARYQGALRSAGELMELAQERNEPGAIIMAHFNMGVNLLMMGSWSATRNNLERCQELYDLERDASLKFEYAEDPCVFAQGANSLALWQLGYPDQAVESMKSAIRLAQQLQHANSIGQALAMAPCLYNMMGDPEASLTSARAISAYAKEKDLPYWAQLTGSIGGWALAKLGKPNEGISEIRRAIESFRSAGNQTGLTGAQAQLADAYRAAGHYDDAMAAIRDGLRFALDQNEGFNKAELLRLEGVTALDRNPNDLQRAETSFLAALETAREQQSRSMELRVSIDLAKLWRARGKAGDAFGLLEPLYAWFTEGFETPDLSAAKALLTELKSSF